MKRRFLALILLVLVLTIGCSNPKKDYQEAEKLNTIEAYDRFLQKHPSSEFADKAKQKIEEIEWQKAINSNTAETYEKFLKKYPQSKLFTEAKRRIEDLNWKNAEEVNTIEAYEHFLQIHPDGQLTKKAKLSIDILKIVKKFPSFYVYEGSEVLILFKPSGKIISLKYHNRKWGILKSEVEEVGSEKFYVLGTVKPGSPIMP